MWSTNEVGLRSQLLRWALLLSLVFAGPGVILSEWFLDKVQARVNDNLSEPWAPDAQRWIAHAFAYTMRRDLAAERYGLAAQTYERHGDMLMASEMLMTQAEEYEAAYKKYHAIPIYKYVAARFEGYPAGRRASEALTRIRAFGGGV